jgi:hypothetical protein
MIVSIRDIRSSVEAYNAKFLQLLPAIVASAKFALRDIKREAREDAVQEVVASAYAAYVRLAERGKADLAYASPLAGYGVAQYRAGRRVGARLNVRDVMSPYARRAKRIRVERLDCYDEKRGGWREAVIEDHRTNVADQAAFRIDFPTWLATLAGRDRQMAEALAMGLAPSEVADRFGLCRARISQKRAQFADSWERFHGGPPA